MTNKPPVHRESNCPVGVYQIWHREGDAYHQVAGLKAGSMLVAAETGMKLPPSAWAEQKEYGAPDAAIRQTKTGDIIVGPDAQAFKLIETTHGFTFEATDLRQAQSTAKLLGEMRADAQMGREEAAMGEFRQSVNVLADILAGAKGVAPQERQNDQGIEM